jgi:hypothetical protein
MTCHLAARKVSLLLAISLLAHEELTLFVIRMICHLAANDFFFSWLVVSFTDMDKKSLTGLLYTSLYLDHVAIEGDKGDILLMDSHVIHMDGNALHRLRHFNLVKTGDNPTSPL